MSKGGEAMIRQCAWCGTSLDTPGIKTVSSGVVSHGICDDCRTDLEASIGVPLDDFLAGLNEPVLLIDRDHNVGAANRAFHVRSPRSPEEIVGQRAGTVFECRNAGLPAGCGHTIHCSGCTIRRAVAHTYETGESKVRVPASIQETKEAGGGQIELRITTVRVGGRVLLRIEDEGQDEGPTPG